MKEQKIPGIVVSDYLEVTKPNCEIELSVTARVMNIYGEVVDVPTHYNCRCSIEFNNGDILLTAEKKE